MTMQPRTSLFSARSAARTTCWYHSGKSSSRRGMMAVFVCSLMIDGKRAVMLKTRAAHRKRVIMPQMTCECVDRKASQLREEPGKKLHAFLQVCNCDVLI